MPWENGRFTRENPDFSGPDCWRLDQRNGTKIEADRHDHHDQDLSDGINNCLAKDGSNQMRADLDLGGFKLVNAGGAEQNDEYMLLGQSIQSAVVNGTNLVLKRPDSDDIPVDIAAAALASVAAQYGSQAFLPTSFTGVKIDSFSISSGEGWLCVANAEIEVSLPATLNFNHTFIIENSARSTHDVVLRNPNYTIINGNETLSAGEDLRLKPSDVIYLVATAPDTLERSGSTGYQLARRAIRLSKLSM